MTATAVESSTMAVPQPPSPSRTAKQRWTLLRTVTRAQTLFRRSLRSEEHALLEQLTNIELNDDKNDNTKDMLPPETTRKDAPQGDLPTQQDCEYRQRLSQVLEETSLPALEASYLRKLIASKKVSSATVDQARRSIVLQQQHHQQVALSHLCCSTLDEEDDDEDEQEEGTALDKEDEKETKEDDDAMAPPATRTSLSSFSSKNHGFRQQLWDPALVLSPSRRRRLHLQGTSSQQASQSSLVLAADDTPKDTTHENSKQQTHHHDDDDDDKSDIFFGLVSSSPMPDCSSMLLDLCAGTTPSDHDQNTTTANDTAVLTTGDPSQHTTKAVPVKPDNENDEENIQYTILGRDEACDPAVLTPPIMYMLRSRLPTMIKYDNFWLKYSLVRDGASMRRLVHALRNSTRTVVAVETTTGHVLGAFCSSPWTPRGTTFFGSGEAFVWRLTQSRDTPCQTLDEQVDLEQDVQIFAWSGRNRNVQRLERPDAPMILGGGDNEQREQGSPTKPCSNKDESLVTASSSTLEFGSALVLSSDLATGYTHACHTFTSPRLVPDKESNNEQETFDIANVEVWTLTPVDTVEQAETVELGRRFIFDQGSFLEQ